MRNDIDIDIDVEYSGNNASFITACSSDTIIDRIEAMKQQEKTYQTIDYYLSSSSSHSNDNNDHNDNNKNDNYHNSNNQSRYQMCDWCYQTIDQYQYKRETVQIAMSYFDRFLSTTQKGTSYLPEHNNGSKMKYQLAMISCLYIAIKFHESITLDTNFFVQLSNGYYTKKQIYETEQIVLFALEWKMNPPTTITFIQHIIDLLSLSSSLQPITNTTTTTTTINNNNSNNNSSNINNNDHNNIIKQRQQTFNFAKYQSELAILDNTISAKYCPSIIAMAIVMNALDHQKSLSLSVDDHPSHDKNKNNNNIESSIILQERISTIIGMDVHSEEVLECRNILSQNLTKQQQREIASSYSSSSFHTNKNGNEENVNNKEKYSHDSHQNSSHTNSDNHHQNILRSCSCSCHKNNNNNNTSKNSNSIIQQTMLKIRAAFDSYIIQEKNSKLLLLSSPFMKKKGNVIIMNTNNTTGCIHQNDSSNKFDECHNKVTEHYHRDFEYHNCFLF